jgi:hypothetical protein
LGNLITLQSTKKSDLRVTEQPLYPMAGLRVIEQHLRLTGWFSQFKRLFMWLTRGESHSFSLIYVVVF